MALLRDPSQIKAAKARCHLLFEAAITISERGVPKHVYAGYQKDVQNERQPKRQFHLDVESKCSIRLQKIAVTIANNKLVAHDVLRGLNLDRVARDPDFYLHEKFEYLRSNTARPVKNNAKSGKQTTQAQDRSRKRRRTKEDLEDEGDDEASAEETDDE